MELLLYTTTDYDYDGLKENVHKDKSRALGLVDRQTHGEIL